MLIWEWGFILKSVHPCLFPKRKPYLLRCDGKWWCINGFEHLSIYNWLTILRSTGQVICSISLGPPRELWKRSLPSLSGPTLTGWSAHSLCPPPPRVTGLRRSGLSGVSKSTWEWRRNSGRPPGELGKWVCGAQNWRGRRDWGLWTWQFSVVLKVWSPRPAASASPGNVLETQILGHHASCAKWWILGVGAAVWAVTSHLGNSNACSCLRTIGLDGNPVSHWVTLGPLCASLPTSVGWEK